MHQQIAFDWRLIIFLRNERLRTFGLPLDSHQCSSDSECHQNCLDRFFAKSWSWIRKSVNNLDFIPPSKTHNQTKIMRPPRWPCDQRRTKSAFTRTQGHSLLESIPHCWHPNFKTKYTPTIKTMPFDISFWAEYYDGQAIWQRSLKLEKNANMFPCFN